ncbi:HTH-type transcriptional regulator CymR [Pelotomaculum schinkii]|uniref:HTH-type transcriptional regulator CymR n=1 Tax=Pelotomaculum schinkii TaxID=78350 RepID=A0A4Y7RHP8_9FIRM|nr:Rrf2 family transcriptional regulator [Pelotomaculum schinkii]TEB08346.1 HTH-type transcriptional regulator CymR [Pelotomaculum schinkii]
MRFSTRARYGLRAMVEFARHYERGEPVPLIKVAENQGISEGYLEQLMTSLRKGGLVRSVRGAQGGYLLSQGPDKITAWDIIRLVEGPLDLTECVNEDEQVLCDWSNTCVTRVLWQRVRDSLRDVLTQINLADLCDDAERIRRSKEADMYYI